MSPSQEDRWKELKSLYELYLNRLAAAGLEDGNAAHIRVARRGIAPENIQHVIVAGVPDLNLISETHLHTLESAGVLITILVDAPNCEREAVRRLGKAGPDSLVAEVANVASGRLRGCCGPGVGSTNCCPPDRWVG